MYNFSGLDFSLPLSMSHIEERSVDYVYKIWRRKPKGLLARFKNNSLGIRFILNLSKISWIQLFIQVNETDSEENVHLIYNLNRLICVRNVLKNTLIFRPFRRTPQFYKNVPLKSFASIFHKQHIMKSVVFDHTSHGISHRMTNSRVIAHTHRSVGRRLLRSTTGETGFRRQGAPRTPDPRSPQPLSRNRISTIKFNSGLATGVPTSSYFV